MTAETLRTEGLTKRFGEHTAVDDVDFEVAPGELRGLIGPNGAGKTTFFNVISGVLAPTAGRVSFKGEDVTDVPPHRLARRGMARSLQIASGFSGLSVFENVLGAVNGQRTVHNPFAPARADDAATERAHRVLDRVGLSDAAESTVADLPHGDKKRLEVALAIAGDPDLLLLDEPTAGLSAGETAAMTTLVRSFTGETAVVLVEHDMDVVMETVDRVTVFHRGAVLAEGAPADIRRDDRVRDVYLGRGR